MRPRLASAAHARATHLRSTQCGRVTPRGTPFCSKIDDGARASLSSSPDTVEPPQAAFGEPQQPCYEYRRPGLLSSSMIDLRSDARSRAEEKERARRALVSKHVGQSREGERDVPKRAAAILGDSLDRREPTVVVRAPTCVTACDQTCLRDPTFDAVNCMQAPGSAWAIAGRAGVACRCSGSQEAPFDCSSSHESRHAHAHDGLGSRDFPERHAAGDASW